MLEGELNRLQRFFHRVVSNPPGYVKCPGGIMNMHTELSAIVFDDKGVKQWEGVLARDKVITANFADALVSAMINSTDADIHSFKYHDSGTGTDAESVTDTDLLSIASETARVSGTQVTATDTASGKSYSSVATVTYTTTSTGLVVSEHGLFCSTSSTDARDKIADRTVFAGITIQNGWQIQFTFKITYVPGG